MGERQLAKEFLHSTEPMTFLRSDQPERYSKLEQLVKRPYFNASDVYEMGSTKEKRRREVAEALATEVSVVQPSRLLVLLGPSSFIFTCVR